MSKTIFFETFGLVMTSPTTAYVGVEKDDGSFSQIGPTLTISSGFHLAELTAQKTQTGASFRLALDNRMVGGWDQFDVHLEKFWESGVDVGTVTLASNYLGGGLIAGGAQDDIEWLPTRNAAGYIVSWQWGDSPFISFDVGNVTSFSHKVPQPTGSFIDINLPPQVSPSADFVQIRPSIGGGSNPIRMFPTNIVHTAVAGGQKELVKLGLLPFPPGGSAELAMNDQPTSTLRLDVRQGADTPALVTISDLYFFPIDQSGSMQQITATAQGLAGRPLEWRIGTDRWGHSYARLHDPNTGEFLGFADVDGAIGCGPGETVFTICALREGPMNSFIPDTTLSFQVAMQRISRWTFLSVPGGGI